ncbi:FIST signal transduction protein [Beggiatoa leptomitoformis]|uniref:Histidine kinase n=1 Tax=Beggiatoa leptomitoformis TaxID=288004 RepID=A0A2N9YGX8_9GAMM|nr:FIST C-terminal domain-containing protein [Beggiatoa leptomitoformis]ALG67948.1 histidine kinase [Beggiatoa leptomitoformis]AUI69778.1 histidine kinase [Beggiatoa leptomitoformis]
MDSFQIGHASATQWQEAMESCLAQMDLNKPANLGFLYLTDKFAESVYDILSHLKHRTQIEHWVGTTGIGICCTGQEYFNSPAIVMMLGQFPENSFNIFSTTNEDFDDFVSTHQTWLASKQPLFAVVHGDPRNQKIAHQITQLSERMGEGFLVGGLTSSRQHYFQIADNITEGNLSGVMFDSNVVVTTRLTQGCATIGQRHQITESSYNVLVKLDDRPALDVFNEDIGEELANDLNQVAGHIFAALPVQGSDTGDYLIRNLVGIDKENKLVAIGELVNTGTPIIFAQRDSRTAREDLIKMLNNIKKGLTTTPKGGVYYSCLGRGANLFGENSEELKIIQSVLGDVPLVGFFANGEISHQRLYGYTGVLTLFL